MPKDVKQNPLKVIIKGVGGSIHTRHIHLLENLHKPPSNIYKPMKAIHQITIKHFT